MSAPKIPIDPDQLSLAGCATYTQKRRALHLFLDYIIDDHGCDMTLESIREWYEHLLDNHRAYMEAVND